MQGGWQPPSGGYGAPPPGYGAGPSGPPNPYATGGQPMIAGHSYGNYEFNHLENGIIDKCAGRAKLWGWISAVLGALQIIGGGCGSLSSAALALYVPYGIVFLIVGITFIGVGNSLRYVVTTQGNDIGHMMQALQKLGSAFLIQSITFLVFVVIGVLIGFLMVFFILVGAAAS